MGFLWETRKEREAREAHAAEFRDQIKHLLGRADEMEKQREVEIAEIPTWDLAKCRSRLAALSSEREAINSLKRAMPEESALGALGRALLQATGAADLERESALIQARMEVLSSVRPQPQSQPGLEDTNSRADQLEGLNHEEGKAVAAAGADSDLVSQIRDYYARKRRQLFASD